MLFVATVVVNRDEYNTIQNHQLVRIWFGFDSVCQAFCLRPFEIVERSTARRRRRRRPRSPSDSAAAVAIS